MVDGIDLLVVSGLSPVDTDPWQAWLEARFPQAAWVRPLDGDWPDLDRWGERIDEALAGLRGRACLALAHGFGALALVRHAAHGRRAPGSAILVAPAQPERFGQDAASIGYPMPYPASVIALQGGAHEPSPWLQDEAARAWAGAWRAGLVDAQGVPPALPAPWAAGEALVAAHLQVLAKAPYAVPAPMRPSGASPRAQAHALRFVGDAGRAP